MATFPFILILISCLSHAYWNYLIKSANNKFIFTAISKLSEVALFLVPGIHYLIIFEFEKSHLILVLVAALFGTLNYIFLTKAYENGSLNLIYPISRSSAIFLPILAFLTIGETVNWLGILSICMILVGVLLMHLEQLNKRSFKSLYLYLNNKGSVYALIAALFLACYTLWDKMSLQSIPPFLYYYLYSVCVALIYGSYVSVKLWKGGISQFSLRQEWRMNKKKIILTGFLNAFTYVIVLVALVSSKATYVGALRQLSVVFGVFLAYRLLGERITTPRLIGVVITIIGGCLIYLAN